MGTASEPRLGYFRQLLPDSSLLLSLPNFPHPSLFFIAVSANFKRYVEICIIFPFSQDLLLEFPLRPYVLPIPAYL